MILTVSSSAARTTKTVKGLLNPHRARVRVTKMTAMLQSGLAMKKAICASQDVRSEHMIPVRYQSNL